MEYTINSEIRPIERAHIYNDEYSFYCCRMWNEIYENQKIKEFVTQKDISYIVNLVDYKHGNVLQAKELYYYIEDYSIPKNVDEFREFVKCTLQLSKNKNIIVHCLAGRGRTSLFVAAMFMKPSIR